MPSTRSVQTERWSRVGPALLLLAACGTAPASRVAPPPLVHAPVEAPSLPVEEEAHEAVVPPAEEAAAETADSEVIEDDAPHSEDGEAALAAELTSEHAPHPLDGWTPERIETAVRSDLPALGSISLGQPNAGALLGGIQAQSSPLFEPVSPSGAFGTEETLRYLTAAIQRVHAEFPNTPPLSLGHISDRNGGPLSPHISHQSGRDVDISFYYSTAPRWYVRANRDNLDLPRTWAFVRALVTETDVEMILIDHSILALLRRHALEIGEDAEWVENLFRGVPGKLPPIFRHAPGHATHIHVRFFNPIAQETARRCYAALVAAGKAREPVTFVRYRAKKGDTLGKLSKRFGVTLAALKAANGLRKSLIRERAEYRIPVKRGAARPPPAPLRFPSRRLPPDAVGAVDRKD